MTSNFCDLPLLSQSLRSICNTNVNRLPCKIKSGISTECLRALVNKQENFDVKELRKLVNDIAVTDDVDERSDLLFDIYKEVFKQLPVTSLSELSFYVKFISLLALLNMPQPQSPLNLFRKLFYTIPEELLDYELMEKIACDMYSTSTDIGDLTHLSMQCSHLGNDWNLLTIKISWLSLTYLLRASERASTKLASLTQLNELLSSNKLPDSIYSLSMTVHLISLLVNHLVVNEYGLEAEASLGSIHKWLTLLPLNFDSSSQEHMDLQYNVDKLTVQGFITNILVNWPKLSNKTNLK